MKTVAIVVRTLRQGKTYEDFRKAWYHTTGFGTQTNMYSLVNALNPREIITIGMVETELEDVPSLLKIDASQRETHPLGDIIEESITRYFGVLVAEDDFSAKGALEYQPPAIEGKETDLKDLAHILDVINRAVKERK
jgi:hypothetical protein